MTENVRYLVAPPPGKALVDIADLERWAQTLLAASMTITIIQRGGDPAPAQLQGIRAETARAAREMTGVYRFGIATHTAGR